MKWIAVLALYILPFVANSAVAPVKPIGEIKVAFEPGEIKVLQITNKGKKPFTIKSIKKSQGTVPDFFDSGSTCVIGKTVAPTESCTFKYAYKPQAKGSKLLTLMVDATTEEYVIRMRGVGRK